MNFDYSEEQQLLADSVRRFLQKDYEFEARKKIVARPRATARRSGRRSPRWASPALPLSPDYGGFGGGAVDLMGVMEAFGEALVVEPFVPTLLGALLRRERRQRCAEAGGAAGGGRRQDEARVRAHRAGLALRPVDVKSRRRRAAASVDGEKSAVLGAPMADKLVVSAHAPGGGAVPRRRQCRTDRSPPHARRDARARDLVLSSAPRPSRSSKAALR